MTEEPRVLPLTAEEWGDAEYAAFGSLMGLPGETVPRAGSGHQYDPLNHTVVGLFVRHPELAKAFWKFNSYQLHRNSLPTRLRELAILRVAHRRRSPSSKRGDSRQTPACHPYPTEAQAEV